jgi:hypothetical protein
MQCLRRGVRPRDVMVPPFCVCVAAAAGLRPLTAPRNGRPRRQPGGFENNEMALTYICAKAKRLSTRIRAAACGGGGGSSGQPSRTVSGRQVVEESAPHPHYAACIAAPCYASIRVLSSASLTRASATSFAPSAQCPRCRAATPATAESASLLCCQVHTTRKCTQCSCACNLHHGHRRRCTPDAALGACWAMANRRLRVPSRSLRGSPPVARPWQPPSTAATCRRRGGASCCSGACEGLRVSRSRADTSPRPHPKPAVHEHAPEHVSLVPRPSP